MSKKNKRTLDIPNEITEALSVPPVDYLRKWWMHNSTDEERKAAEDRDATIEGAYAFVEDFCRRAKHDGGACLPDQLVYDLTGIFMRICVDGDVYATAEEIAKDEAEERKRAEAEARRKEEAEARRAKAEEAEAERLAALTPEQRAAEEAEKAEREEREARRREQLKAEQEKKAAAEKLRKEKREEAARKKALAEELERRQMTFF